MAKGWKNFGSNGLVQSEETIEERQRRLNKIDSKIRSMKPIKDDFEYKKYLEESYAKAIAEENRLIDVVDNNRTTNEAIIEKVKKIKASRAKKEKKNTSNN